MAQCPNCSKPISINEDNYGTLYRCEHCQVESFIGFDGMPENSKEPLVSEDEPEMSQLAVNVIIPESPAAAAEADPYASGGSDSTPPDLYSIEPGQRGGDYDANSSFQNDQNDSQANSERDIYSKETAPPPVKSSGAFDSFTQDVRDFGNDSAASGILSFDIEISGIDLGELKRDLLEALDDKRFGWNLPELSQRIKDGKLTIKNVSAPKIIVLVKRITPIGLSLNWRHHVSTQ